MKRKKLLHVILFVFIFTVIIVVYLNTICSEEKNVYAILDEQLNYKENLYIACELSVNAIELEKPIGVTHDGKQIFSIKGEDKADFICLRVDGREIVFRNIALNPVIDVKRFDFDKMIIRSMDGIEDEVIIEDNNVINEMLNMIDDKNLVQGDVVGETFHNITLYSAKYVGLSYSYLYVVDENGDEYLFDSSTDLSWKFNKHLFDVKMR